MADISVGTRLHTLAQLIRDAECLEHDGVLNRSRSGNRKYRHGRGRPLQRRMSLASPTSFLW
ncbi:MAG: hypothetical protein ACSLEN_01205 [Candidatus Malihini olakiniferum]